MKARLFDKQSSGFDEVTIEFKDEKLLVHTQDKTMSYNIQDISFSQRLGNMPRSIYLNDDKVCECADNEAIDAELKKLKVSSGASFIHHLESKSRYILPALFITILVLFSFIKIVIPYTAKHIAYSIPQSLASKIGTGTLETLDKLVLNPSKISKEKQEEIQKDFKNMVANLQDLPPLVLEFRHSKKIGPNAFALPNGSIIMTDELVILSNNNKELLSILAHEIGHIKNRHSLRMVFQNSAAFLLLTTLTGDATTASSLLSALPTMLIESSFSRELESEADDYAMEVMKERGIELHYFADIMSRLVPEKDDEGKMQEYFASHPITSSRIAKFQK